MQDLRRFTVKNCAGQQEVAKLDDQKRKEFFGGLGKVGDIEVLNRFGGAKITAGLRALSKTSDSIRTGNTNSSIIPNDSGYVLDAVGINPNAAKQAGQFNPGVLNRGIAQAESILNDVKSGNFSLDKIPNVITDIQNLGSLVDGIFTDSPDQSIAQSVAACGASPYAVDLVTFAPKYKFLFVVQISLKPEYKPALDAGDESLARSLAFVVKTSTRPNVNIEHEEINMYNFWTRVPKRTVYEPITMRFYDDNKGLAHLFYTTYLKHISPLSRQGGFNGEGLLTVDYLQANSMNKNGINNISTASLSALEGNNTSIIDEIKLFHIYDYGKFMNVYHFHHPKLLTMNLDDLDMSDSGTGNEIEFQFAYDALHITPGYDMQENKETIKAMTTKGKYPIDPNFKLGAAKETPAGTNAEGGAPKVPQTNVFETITGAIESGANTVTGLVSNAYKSASDFIGSNFL